MHPTTAFRMAARRRCRSAAAAAASLLVTTVLLLLRVPAVAAAAVAQGPGAFIPFPAPPGGTAVGRLHALPALQCRLPREGPPGLCAPPSWSYPWAARPPPDDDDHRTTTSGLVSDGPAAGETDDGGGGVGRPPGALRRLFRDLSLIGNPAKPDLDLTTSLTWVVPPAAAGAGVAGGVVYPGAVVRALTLRRNSVGGHVRRVRGHAFDALVFSHTTVGRCPGEAGGGCGLPTALDTLGARRGAPLAALTVTTPAAGRGEPGVHRGERGDAAAGVSPPAPPTTRLVTMADAPLLSIGRAVVADGRWLAAADARAPPPATLTLRLGWAPPPPLRLVTAWALGDGSAAGVAASAAWLASTASVLCGVAPAAFVRDVGGLCRGVPRARLRWRRRQRLRGGGPSDGNGGGPAGGVAVPDELLAAWEVGPPPVEAAALAPPVAPCPPAANGSSVSGDSSDEATAAAMAATVASAMTAELAPSGPPYGTPLAEAQLADVAGANGTAEPDRRMRLGWCALSPAPPLVATGGDAALGASPRPPVANATSVDAALVRSALDWGLRLSANWASFTAGDYTRSAFREELPAPPTTDIELILAVIVVAPEFAALALLGLTSAPAGDGGHRGRRRDRQAFLLILATGLLSLGGIVAIGVAERHGAAWRVAAVAERAAAHRTDGTTGWGGVLVTHTERLTVLAPVGYRPRLVGGLAIGLVTVYVGVAAVSAGRLMGWWWRWPWQWRRRAAVEVGGTDQEAAPPWESEMPTGDEVMS